MAVQTSTVPTALANLKTLIAADATIVSDAVQVAYGLPMPFEEDEFIGVGYRVEHDQEQAAIANGRWPRDETFTISSVVSVVRQGPGEMQTAVERAYAIAARIEAVMYATDGTGITLTVSGTPAVRAAVIVGLSLDQNVAPSAKAVEARVTVLIRCTARRIST